MGVDSRVGVGSDVLVGVTVGVDVGTCVLVGVGSVVLVGVGSTVLVGVAVGVEVHSPGAMMNTDRMRQTTVNTCTRADFESQFFPISRITFLLCLSTLFENFQHTLGRC